MHDWKEDNPRRYAPRNSEPVVRSLGLFETGARDLWQPGKKHHDRTGLQEVDASLEKVFKPIERMNIEARAEIFNLLDHANFIFLGSTSLREAPV